MDRDALRSMRRDRMSMVFQHFALFPHMSILENVAYGLRVQGVEVSQRHRVAADALETVGLQGWENSTPAQMSGGMKQRVGLARALATDPDILLMDEPFRALDPLIRTEVQDELLAMEEQLRKTIVFITHDLDEALKMGDRIVLMKDGRVVQVGTSEETLTQPANEYVSNFVENVDVTKVLTAGDIMQPVDAVAYLRDGPRTALHRLGRAGLSGLFVVSRDGRHHGYVTVDALEQAVERNAEGTVEDLLDSESGVSIGTDTPIREVFRLMHEVRSPLPVVDDEDRLKGVIVRGAVISGVATRGDMEGEADVD